MSTKIIEDRSCMYEVKLRKEVHKLQSVNTVSDRKMVINWMIHHVDQQRNSERIASQAVTQFPKVSRQTNRSVNREKARHSRVHRETYLAVPSHVLSSFRKFGTARSRIEVKSYGGRG